MKEESSTVWGRLTQAKMRRRLVTAQVAACLALLVLGGLLMRGVQHALVIDPGFATTDVVAVSLDIPQQNYAAPRTAALYRELAARVHAIDGARSVALAASIPWSGRTQTRIQADTAASMDGAGLEVGFAMVSSDYFRTMSVAVVAGRSFSDADRSVVPTPVVVSERMAAVLWPRAGAVGGRFRDDRQIYQVVGVARDVRNVDLAQPDGPFFYAPADTANPFGLTLLVRAPGRAGAVATAIPGAVRSLDPDVHFTVMSLDERIRQLTAPSRAAALLAALLGLFGMLLALVGVYGLLNYTVRLRTRELAVRLAIGAVPRDIVSLVVRQGAQPVLAGLVIGTMLAVGVSQLIKGMLFGASELDPMAFVGTIVTVSSAAAAAMYFPARRAARVDPAVTLRSE